MAETKSKVPEIIPTILVGCGGTGYKILKEVNRLFKNSKRFEGHAPEMIEFLSFDTDAKSDATKGDNAELDPTDKVNLKIHAREVLDNIDQFPEIKRWFPKKLMQHDVSHGAGQIRAMGRLALFYDINRIRDAVVKKIKQVMDKSLINGKKFASTRGDAVPPNVYVVGSTGGGTGAGMFIDMAYIVRELFYQEEKVDTQTFGYLFMPDAFDSVLSTNEKQSVSANGVAALKELDYYMQQIEPFNVKYTHDFKIENVAKSAPFKFCYLVSDNGVNDQDILHKITAEKIFHGIASEFTQDTKSMLSNVTKNAFAGIKDGDFMGTNTNYSSFGVASCVFPTDQLLDVYSDEFAASMMQEIREYESYYDGEVKQRPFAYEADAFLNTSFYFMRDSVSGEPQFFEKLMPLQDACKKVTSKCDFVKVTENAQVLAVNIQKTDQSIAELEKEMDSRAKDFYRHLSGEFSLKIDEMMSHPGKGVDFCIHFCEETLRRFEGFLLAVQKNQQKLVITSGRTTEELRDEQERLKKEFDKWFSSKARKLEIAENLAVLLNNKSKSNIDVKRKDFAQKIIFKLKSSVEKTIDKLREFSLLISRLEGELRKNSITSNTSSFEDKVSNNPFLDKSVVAGEDLRWFYDEVLQMQTRVRDFEIEFLKSLNLGQMWSKYYDDEPRFLNDVRVFSKKLLLSDLKTYTIEDFLVEKNKRSEYEQNQIFANLCKLAEPLWQVNKGNLGAGYKFQPLNLAGVKDRELEGIVHEKIKSVEQDINFISTGDPHKITIIRSLHGAPLLSMSKLTRWEESVYAREKQTHELHAITPEEISIDSWDERPFLPEKITIEEGTRIFALAAFLKFIQRVDVEGKKYYYMSSKREKIESKNVDRYEMLGPNRISARNEFIKKPAIRRISNLIDKCMASMGSYELQIERLQKYADRLEGQLQNPSLQKAVEAKALYEIELRAIKEYISRVKEQREREALDEM